MPNADNYHSRADGASLADYNIGNWGVKYRAVAIDEGGRCDADSQAVVHVDGLLDVGNRGMSGRGARSGAGSGGSDGRSVVVCSGRSTWAVGTAVERLEKSTAEVDPAPLFVLLSGSIILFQ